MSAKTDAELQSAFSSGKYPSASDWLSLIHSKSPNVAQILTPSGNIDVGENSSRFITLMPTVDITVKLVKTNLREGEMFQFFNASSFLITYVADDLSVIGEKFGGMARFQSKIDTPLDSDDWRTVVNEDTEETSRRIAFFYGG